MSEEVKPFRYAIGIDLGTTNSVMSYVELSEEPEAQDNPVFPVPQLTAPGVVESKDQLPSFLYQAHESEISESDRVLPWSDHTAALVGQIARNLGGKTPLRLVASAKSWLCHGGVDRRSAFLPQNSPDEVQKVSPLEASIRYLEHLRDAWNHDNPEALMENQDVTLTIPASPPFRGRGCRDTPSRFRGRTPARWWTSRRRSGRGGSARP